MNYNAHLAFDAARSNERRTRVLARAKRFISLFSGCGGLDCGFQTAGFLPVAAFDIDSTAVDTYNHNLGKRATKFDLKDWSNLRNLASEKADLLIAGPPCQGFSPPGTRNPIDERNGLLLVPIRLGLVLRIPLIVIENVPGLLMERYAPLRLKLEGLLRNGGYRWEFLNLSAAAAGLPQLRKRIVLVARRGTSELAFPKINAPITPILLRDVLRVGKTVPNHVPRILEPTSRSGRIAAHIGQGQKLCNVRAGASAVHTWQIPEVFGKVTRSESQFLELMIRLRRRNRRRENGDSDPVDAVTLRSQLGATWHRQVDELVRRGHLRTVGAMFDLCHAFNGKFRRLAADQPAHCVLTKFCEAPYFLHPFENRAFTPREAARIQGFPDDFEFFGSERAQARMIGNAVPPPLAHIIAQYARAAE